MKRRIAPHFTSTLNQAVDQWAGKTVRIVLVDQKGFRRAADAEPAHLRVQDDIDGHRKVRTLVHIDVANPLQMGKHRYPRLGLYAPHKPFAAAGDDHVNCSAEACQHFAHRLSVGHRHQLNGCFGKARSDHTSYHTFMDDAGCIKTVRTPAQDNRIPGLKTQCARVCGHVGTAFIDHSHHTEWRPHPLNMEPVRPVPLSHDGPNRVREISDRRNRSGHVQNAGFIQLEPVEHWCGEIIFLTVQHVDGVGCQDIIQPVPQGFSRAHEGSMLALSCCDGQGVGRFFRARAHIQHQRCDVGGRV